MAERKNLGRGLSALLGEESDDVARLDRVRGAKPVAIELLHPGKYQPRHTMDDDAIADLAQSIREKGILQPLLVRRHPDDRNAFEIIAGERRWRAAQMAKLHEVPVVIKDLDDQETLEVALIENLQREDLSALEEAEAFRQLMDEFSHTQEALAQALGKSRSHVANTLRLLSLPDEVKAMLDDGRITAGHARALLNAPDPVAAARRVVSKGLNVRQTEQLAKHPAGEAAPKRRAATAKDADTRALEQDLADLLGIRVEIAHGKSGGRLILHYATLDQLDSIIERLSQGGPSTAPQATAAPAGPDGIAATATRLAPVAPTAGTAADIADAAEADTPKLAVSLKPKRTTKTKRRAKA